MHVEKYFIHLIINEGNAAAWELTAVYASPKHHLRPLIWDQILAIRCNTPWALIGDFNCTLRDGERNKPGGVSRQFESWVHHLGLLDTGFIGPVFTWNHGRELEVRQSARLDRLLCNDEWRRLFPEASLLHLPHSYLDHCPLFLQTSPVVSTGLGRRPFCFVAA